MLGGVGLLGVRGAKETLLFFRMSKNSEIGSIYSLSFSLKNFLKNAGIAFFVENWIVFNELLNKRCSGLDLHLLG